MPKLTKRLLDAIEPEPERDTWLWDTDPRGFGVRVKPSGVKTFVIQYRTVRGDTRRHSLGQYGRLTVDEARTLARIKLGEVEKGHDPSAERKEARRAMTVADLCDTYLNDAKAGKVMRRGKAKKASTLLNDQSRINRHIKPLIGNKPLQGLKRGDVTRLMHDVIDGKTSGDRKTGPRGRSIVRGGRGAASKVVSLLGAMCNYAVTQGWLEANPCHGVEKPADNKRDRFLSPDEYRRLGAALDDLLNDGENVMPVAAIRALALTGCRKGEILTLTGRAVDPAGRCLRLEDTKTGKQLRPCGRDALAFLAGMKAEPANYVFPAARGEGYITDIRKTMIRACQLAELEEVTPHVLRHSFATVAHELGYSELTIAGLLGHSAHGITARYAHHVDSALAAAADAVAATVAARMKGEEAGGNVVPINRAG